MTSNLEYMGGCQPHHIEKETLFAGVRPRLMRLARLRGVPPDAIEDVVQETMLVAWAHLELLSEPEHFQIWLDAICRNICARYLRAHYKDALRHISLFDPSEQDELDAFEASLIEKKSETEALDPAEVLSRSALTDLLRQALGLLPDQAREAVELYYLLDVPQREAAVRMGLSISAMETRLHRARRQLRQILNADLRQQASAFDLPLDDEAAQGWQNTSLWCYYCGQYRLQGRFETKPGTGRSLRLRCPSCSQSADGVPGNGPSNDIVNGRGLVQIDTLRSFRTAFKRTMQGLSHYLLQAVAAGKVACRQCGAMVPVRVSSQQKEQFTASNRPISQRQFWVRGICPNCACKAAGFSADDAVFGSTPLIQQFIQHHPRWMNEPDIALDYQGQPAILFRISDHLSAEKLEVITHRATLDVLDVFQN